MTPLGDFTSDLNQERTDVSRAKAENMVKHRARRPQNDNSNGDDPHAAAYDDPCVTANNEHAHGNGSNVH